MRFFRILMTLFFCWMAACGQSQSKAVGIDSMDFYCEKVVSGINAGLSIDDARDFIAAKGIKERLNKNLDANVEKLITDKKRFIFYVALAFNYHNAANFKETQPLLIKALRVSEGANDPNYQCMVYNMIGNLFAETDMYESAIANFNRAMKLAIKAKEESTLCTVYGNMASCFYRYGEMRSGFIDSARKYNNLTIELAQKLKKLDDLNLAYQTKGLIETDLENFKEAEIAFRKAISISAGFKDKSEGNYVQYQLARMFIDMGTKQSADSAIKHLTLAKNLAISYKDNNLLNEVLYEFARVYQLNGEYKQSAYYSLRFAEFNDSLIKLVNARTNAELSEKYESVKREAQITELNLSQKEKQAQIDRQLYMIIGSVIILVFVGFAAFSLYRSNKIRKKANFELSEKNNFIEAQKKEVERQKELVDEKNKEILDSIRYAKRIQQSLMPTEKYIERNTAKNKKSSNK